MNRLLANRTAHTSQAMLPESLFLMFQKIKYKKYEGVTAQFIEVQNLSGI